MNFINNLSGIYPNAAINRTQANSPMQSTQALPFDTFTRCNDVKIDKSDLPFEDEIQEIYNETYSKFLSDNPILNKLNYTMPAVKFKEEGDTEALCSYNFQKNSIELSRQLEDDFYICIAKDKDGEIEFISEPDVSDEIDRKFDSYKEELPSVQKIKLTDEEKELFISSSIAHELRHSLQDHLIASTEGCKDDFARVLAQNEQEIKGSIQNVIDLKKEMEDLTGKSESTSIEYELQELSELGYATSYAPSTLLDESTTLDFLESQDGAKKWSVKEHFLPCFTKRSGNSSYTDYIAQPVEIDAYNYQTLYLLKAAKNAKSPNIRQDVMNALILNCRMNVDEGLANMEQKGYPAV